MKAVLSISTGCPDRSYKAMTKWKKLDFLRLLGGCFSKCALPTPILEEKIFKKMLLGKNLLTVLALRQSGRQEDNLI